MLYYNSTYFGDWPFYMLGGGGVEDSFLVTTTINFFYSIKY